MSYRSRLHQAFKNAHKLTWNTSSRYVIISDCHRGNGSSSDNFLKNQNLYFTALRYYAQSGFSYIELGDGDELWENRNMSQIIEIHNNVFWMFSLLHQKNRLFMIFGNHDLEKQMTGYSQKCCSTYYCSNSQCHKPLFPDLIFHESLILESADQKNLLHLTHGHQVSLLNSRFYKIARFLVRFVWKPLENFGVLDPTSAAKNYSHKAKSEKRLTRFATENNIHLVCGHTHRPMLNPQNLSYINTGSCVHPRCITCLEVTGFTLCLVKWTYDTKQDRTLIVSREILSCVKLD